MNLLTQRKKYLQNDQSWLSNNIVVHRVHDCCSIHRHYSNTGSSSSARIPQGALPPGTAAPQVVLAAEPVSTNDLNLVSIKYISSVAVLACLKQ